MRRRQAGFPLMDWLDLAKTAFEGSTTYFDANLRKQKKTTLPTSRAGIRQIQSITWIRGNTAASRSCRRLDRLSVRARRPSRRRFLECGCGHRRRSGSVEHAPSCQCGLDEGTPELPPTEVNSLVRHPDRGVSGGGSVRVVCSYQDWMHRTGRKPSFRLDRTGLAISSSTRRNRK